MLSSSSSSLLINVYVMATPSSTINWKRGSTTLRWVGISNNMLKSWITHHCVCDGHSEQHDELEGQQRSLAPAWAQHVRCQLVVPAAAAAATAAGTCTVNTLQQQRLHVAHLRSKLSINATSSQPPYTESAPTGCHRKPPAAQLTRTPADQLTRIAQHRHCLLSNIGQRKLLICDSMRNNPHMHSHHIATCFHQSRPLSRPADLLMTDSSLSRSSR
jgi:hypothetical protein